MKKYFLYLIICIGAIIVIVLSFVLKFNSIKKQTINPVIPNKTVDIIAWDQDAQMDLQKEIEKIRGISQETSSLIYDILLHNEKPYEDIDELPGIGPSTLGKIKELWEIYSQSWNF